MINNVMVRRAVLGIVMVSILSCSQLKSTPPASYSYQEPANLDTDWPVASLQSQQIATKQIEQLTDQIVTEQYRNIHSLLIVKNGKLVYENYFNGYTSAVPEKIYSATKSITSALVGIAVDKGFIKRLDDKVLSYFPEYSSLPNLTTSKQQITVRDLLTMSSGLACNDDDPLSPGHESKMYQSQDWMRFILSLPTTNDPGKVSQYCTGGVALLSGIIQKATGQAVDSFAQQHLFGPLNIQPTRWEYMPTGQVNTSGMLFIRPRDMAKIGQLFLNKGQWQGKQVISERWVEESTQKQVLLRNQEYGYLWWRGQFQLAAKSYPCYYASGNGGHFIVIFPTEQLVVVTTAGNLNSGLTAQVFRMLQSGILPALQ